jgi:thioredoxin reductase (NADPH)
MGLPQPQPAPDHRAGRAGERRDPRQDEVLFREGQQNCDFFVVLAGKVAVIEGARHAGERIIAMHGPARFLGELSLLTGEASYYTAVVAEPGEVLAVPLGRSGNWSPATPNSAT